MGGSLVTSHPGSEPAMINHPSCWIAYPANPPRIQFWDLQAGAGNAVLPSGGDCPRGRRRRGSPSAVCDGHRGGLWRLDRGLRPPMAVHAGGQPRDLRSDHDGPGSPNLLLSRGSKALRQWPLPGSTEAARAASGAACAPSAGGILVSLLQHPRGHGSSFAPYSTSSMTPSLPSPAAYSLILGRMMVIRRGKNK